MEGSEPRVRIPLLKRKPKIKVQIKEVVVEGLISVSFVGVAFVGSSINQLWIN